MSSLFSEITIRNIRIKNRIVMPPMACPGFTGSDGLFTLKNLERYRDRARGGVGLIIVEAAAVSQNGRTSPTQLGLWSDDQIKGFSRLAAYCHDYDCRVVVQICHAGLAADAKVTETPVAPSDFKGSSRQNQIVRARALDLTEIARIRDEFIAAAVRAKKAGLDGLELHAAQGFLISQFLSPLVNRRTDEYGGNLENRARFALEIISGIRQEAGEDFILSCRTGCDEPDLESSLRIAQLLEKAGVDILNISTGMTSFIAGEIAAVTVPKYFHYNSIVYRGTLIKKEVQKPVIVGDGIQNPLDAGYLVDKNYADFVSIGRGLLVDPEWPNKGQKYLQVTPCLRCKKCAYRSPPGSCPQTRTVAVRKKHYY
ncbi:MAG TPA: NADH:flavin oxidoreductase [Dehalococcoidales bacterium]|nr:NADH:flavin oxidoreductase [Dehalococcoidales bacterium]